VEGVLVKMPSTDDLGDLVVTLSEKISARLKEAGPSLTASAFTIADPLPSLVAQLADRRKPVIAVVIPENHIAQRRPATLDPAVETEIKKMLQAAGFTIKDVKGNALADWAASFDVNRGGPWPQGLEGVEMVIVGEGFSEFLTRIGNLVSAAARAEVNLIDRSSGRILLADRTDTRAVDLAENIAGKKALQAAGRRLGLEILRHFARTLPEAQGPAPANEKAKTGE
jgi:hypothetical protein